jgi:hypothetical protein
MSTDAAPSSLSELSETLYHRLVSSGEWARYGICSPPPLTPSRSHRSFRVLTSECILHRLTRQLRLELEANGWEDRLRAYAKDKVAQQPQPRLGALIGEVTPFAKGVY